jgi:hypothetical protein
MGSKPIPGDGRAPVTLKCKYCGNDTELSDHEAEQIRADLDRRYTRDEQNRMPMSVICARCVPAHTRRIVEAAAVGSLRLKRIRGERKRRPSIRHVPKSWRERSLN